MRRDAPLTTETQTMITTVVFAVAAFVVARWVVVVAAEGGVEEVFVMMSSDFAL